MRDISIFKIIVAGDGGVGKTTLLHRYVNGEFLEETPMTIGLDIFNKEINVGGTSYKVIFWDVGGQEQFRTLHGSFIKGAMGAIFMFDMSRLSTLKSLDEWLGILRIDDKDIPILLVGSKYDLVAEYMEKTEIADLNEYALEIKKNNDLADYIVTSSKIGYNIDNAFLYLLEKVRNHLNLKQILRKFDFTNASKIYIP